METEKRKAPTLSYSDLLKLKRLNTPTIYNGWERISKTERTARVYNREETRDFMPWTGPMVGYAVTVVIEPSDPRHLERNPDAWSEYRRYIAEGDWPKIVVVQDLDKPHFVGAFWGEVNSSIHRALGCVGTITDGTIRDVDETLDTGFKSIASRLCVGHAYAYPVRWNCQVEVFGCPVHPGQLIHADQHGFLVIPEEDEAALLEAALFADSAECNTIIPAAKMIGGRSKEQILDAIERGKQVYDEQMRRRFAEGGEW